MSEEFSGRIILSAGPASRIATKAPNSADGEPLWATDTSTLYICQGGKAIQISPSGGLATVAVASAGGLSGDGDTTPLRINSANMPDNPEPDAAAYLAILGGDGADVERCKIGDMLSSVVSGGVTISSAGAATVTAIRGVNISAATPATNQVLTYNGTVWTPAALPASPPPPPAVDVGNIPGPLRIGSFQTVSFTSNSTISVGSTTTHLDLSNTSGSTRQVLGFTGGDTGRVLYVTVTGSSITLRKDSSSASVGNRINAPGSGSDIDLVTLNFGETATFVYRGSSGSGYWEYSANSPLSVPIERVSNRGALASLNSVTSNLLNLTTDTTTGSYSVASGTFTATGREFTNLVAGTYLLLVEADVGIGISAGPDAEIQCELWNSTAGSAIATRSMNKGFGTAAVAGRHSFFVLFTLSATSTVQLRARRLSSGSPTWSFSNLSGIVMTYIRIG
ncbi:hypothetical protein [Tuwongella immobilis]|uniref:Uncharacterized protein n=1 Tax=Tuwongella immobilis TaxID=692036 RepID=A0A6C2YML8_9BACT|nr:hypothetical protein [Tuwongella immobilis]VIP02162.1 unnamed protein product [Tuwongella immobilis]VTS00573.1 unnamed protein product [Tuwongella immobilis]